MMMRLARADVERGAVAIDGNAGNASGLRRLPMDPGHAVFEQNFDAGLQRRGMKRSHQAGTGPDFEVVRIGRSAGMDHGPVLDRNLHGAQHRSADLVSDAVRLPVDHFDAMCEQEFESRHAIVGEGADDLTVVVAVGRKAVGLDHRPVGQVLEEQLGRILDAVSLLVAGAAAERQIAAAGDGVAADVVLRLDQDDRRAGLARDDGRRQARGARADHHDVGLAIPLIHSHTQPSCLFCCRHAAEETNSIAVFVSWEGNRCCRGNASHGGFRCHPSAHP